MASVGSWLWAADQLTCISGSQQVPQKSEVTLDGKPDSKVLSRAGQGPQLSAWDKALLQSVPWGACCLLTP